MGYSIFIIWRLVGPESLAQRQQEMQKLPTFERKRRCSELTLLSTAEGPVMLNDTPDFVSQLRAKSNESKGFLATGGPK